MIIYTAMNSGARAEYPVDRIKVLVQSPVANPDYKKTPEFEKRYLKKAGGHIGLNIVQT